jgi:hypothetical protein
MKLQYQITADYVRDWSVRDAIRELVANAIDGEVTSGGKFEAKHDAKKEILHLINRDTKVDARALYFGGTSKYGDDRLIGQYGEGLKIAMLVLARTGIKLVIRNGDEIWQPAIEPDKLGFEVLTLNIKKGSDTNVDFKVEVHGVNTEAWHTIQDMFLHLRKPAKIETTHSGEVIRDADYVGKIFVKGVYCTHRPNYSTGYNFRNLDIGRDRRIPSGWDMDYTISRIWEELATHDAAHMNELYKTLRSDGAEGEAFKYCTVPAVAKGLVSAFREEFGEDAYPVSSVSEASELDHMGKLGVVVNSSLASLLKKELPAKEIIQAELKRSIVDRVQPHALDEAEKAVLLRGMELVQAVTGKDVGMITQIVVFKDTALRGTHKAGEISIARKELKDLGQFVVTLLHEYAHEFGGDGDKSHVDTLQAYMERLINLMEAK